MGPKIALFFKCCNETVQNTNDYNISRVLMKHMNEESGNYTLEELAEEANISASSISRFVNKAGFSSFQEFKYEMLEFASGLYRRRTRIQGKIASDYSEMDPMEALQHRIERNVEATKQQVSISVLEKIAKEMLAAKSVSILGDIHEQMEFSLLQMDLAANRVPTYLYLNHNIQTLHIEKLQEGDMILFLAVSQDFFSSLFREYLKKAKERNVKVIAFTQDPGYLDEYVEKVYLYGIPETFNDGYYSLYYMANLLNDLVYQV